MSGPDLETPEQARLGYGKHSLKVCLNNPSHQTEALPRRADVAIVGGGPAGAATAVALCQRGLRVVLLERLEGPRLQVGETLPPDVRPHLEALGVWEQFLAQRHLPSVGNRSSWGSSEPQDLDFIFSPYGPGWHIDRRRFQELLLAAAREAGATVQLGVKPGELETLSNDAEQGSDIALSPAGGGQRLHARFVVDASGRASIVARARGVARHGFDRMAAIAAYVKPGPAGPATDRATLIEAVEGGWWYSALLPADQMIVAYMTDADLVKSQLAAAGGWSGLLRRAGPTRERVASHGSEMEGEPRVVSANSSCLAAFAGAGWLAVGDAAASYDPLSSQGITVALSSGIEAAEAIAIHLGARASGGAGALSNYDHRRRRDFFDYLVLRAGYYALEKRFAYSEFWRRRQPTATPLTDRRIR